MKKTFSIFINLLVISALLAISLTGTAGNRLSATEADGSSIHWSYDDAYRLTNETRRANNNAITFNASFTYDPAGNRLSQNVNGSLTNYTYNELDQLLTAGSTQYQYDPRGNMISATTSGQTAQYGYDAQNRLINTSLPDGTNIANVYDPSGHRVQQSIDSQVTNYLWDELSPYGDVVLETNGSNTTGYTLAGTELISQTRNNVVSYYLQDGQGSIRGLADINGNVTDNYAYTAFGELYNQSGSTANHYLYTGQQYDSGSGLYSLRARYYEPADGRFISRDIYSYNFNDPFELNRYVYTANNPTNAVDPTGYQIMVEYAQVNRQAEEETPPVQVVGRQVVASVDEQQLAFRAIEINKNFPPYTKSFSTFAEGEVVNANGTRQTIVALNRNQWVKMARIYDKTGAVGIQTEQEAVAFLRARGVLSQSDLALTSQDIAGISFSDGVHAEEIIMRWAVQNNFKPTSIVATNNPCITYCQALAKELASTYMTG